MSLLLEALRKAERDRTLGQPPSPAAVAAAPTPVPSTGTAPSPGRFRTLIALALLVTLCAIALLLRPSPLTAPSAITQTAPARTTGAPVPTPPETLPQTPTVATAETPAPTPMRLAQIDVEDPPGRPPSLGSGEVPAGTPASEQGVADESTGIALEMLQQPVAEPMPAVAPVPDPAAAVPPEDAANDTVSPAPGAPTLRMLPAEQRARFPNLTLDVHAWDSAPERRFVLVNGKRYAPGDPLPGGLVLREIVPDGVIVEFEDRRVMVPRPG